MNALAEPIVPIGVTELSEETLKTNPNKSEERVGRTPLYGETLQADAYGCPPALKKAVIARSKQLTKTYGLEVSKAELIRIGLNMVLNSTDATVMHWLKHLRPELEEAKVA